MLMKTILSFTIRLYVFISMVSIAFAQGSLNPPGAPAPNFKTLSQIEPRTPISSLPITISTPGSYYLTTNLTFSGLPGFLIQCDDVTIDLNGFTVTGDRVSSGVSCPVAPGGRKNVHILNGSFRNCFNGIDCAAIADGRLENVLVFSNSANGMSLGRGWTISHCTVSSNNFDGIHLGSNCRVVDCVTELNNGSGIIESNNCMVSGCVIQSNGFCGIITGDGTTIVNCSINDSRGAVSMGIRAGLGCTIQSCVVRNSGSHGILALEGSTVMNCTVRSSAGTGILLDSNCSAVGCTVILCTTTGISLSDGSTADHCTVSLNGVGISTPTFFANVGCLIKDCNLSGNSTNGIIAGGGTTVRDCTIANNGVGIAATESTIAGCTVTFNNFDGIDATNNTQVVDNNCAHNGQAGVGDGIVLAGSNNRVEGNNVAQNHYGIRVAVAGNFIVKNSARANGTNYFITGTQTIGPIISTTGTITTNNPWANFSF
jgi:parallel beta-helix repeat protein